MRILVVEDDKGAARFIKKGLSEEGFMADVVSGGEEGLFLATTMAQGWVCIYARGSPRFTVVQFPYFYYRRMCSLPLILKLYEKDCLVKTFLMILHLMIFYQLR